MAGRPKPGPFTLSANHSFCCWQKLVARTEQEMVNQIQDREMRVSQLKKKMEAAKVRR